MDAPRPGPTLPPPSSAPAAPISAPPQLPAPGAPTAPDPQLPGGTPLGGIPAPGAAWSPPPISLSLEPVTPPRRSRVLLAVVAVLALAIAGIGAVYALWGGGGDDSVVAVEESSAFSLAAAAQQAATATTVRFDMEMTMGSLGAVSVSGGIDTDAQLMTMTMGLDAMFGGGASGGEFEAIIDVGNGVMYMSAPGEMGLPTDAAWVSMDLAAVAEQSGMSLEEFQQQFAANPLDVATLFTEVDGQFTDQGLDTIDGETVRHYVVAVDWADVLSANPQLESQLDLAESGFEFPDSIDYDVWVTEDNQLRRMVFAIDMLGEEMVVEMNVTDVGEPLDVEFPDAGDVMDLTAFLTGS